ncbi:hypothetical protein VTG60DRAFT_3599 [Thermothelomyces hinnuleus]
MLSTHNTPTHTKRTNPHTPRPCRQVCKPRNQTHDGRLTLRAISVRVVSIVSQIELWIRLNRRSSTVHPQPIKSAESVELVYATAAGRASESLRRGFSLPSLASSKVQVENQHGVAVMHPFHASTGSRQILIQTPAKALSTIHRCQNGWKRIASNLRTTRRNQNMVGQDSTGASPGMYRTQGGGGLEDRGDGEIGRRTLSCRYIRRRGFSSYWIM